MSKYTNDIYYFIDRRMSKKEAHKFILRLEKDEELKKEYLMIKDLNEHMKGKKMAEESIKENNINQIEKSAFDDVQEFLNEEHKDEDILKLISKEEDSKREDKSVEISKGNDIKRKNTRKIYLWTISVASVLILAFVLIKFIDRAPLNERILTEYHSEPLKLNDLQTRDKTGDINRAFKKASTFYLESKFTEAYDLFEQIVQNDPDNVQAIFYSGLCQFESRKNFQSIEIFNSVIQNFDEYYIECKWLISLAYIKESNFKEASKYLEEVGSQKSKFQASALDILERIKE